MYLQFFGLVLSTYLSVTLTQLGSNYVFNKIMYLRTNKYINTSYKKWLENNPQDEWISVNMDNKSYKQRTSEGSYEITEDSDSDSDSEIEDDELDIVLEETENVINKSRFSQIIKTMYSDNRTTFNTSYKSIMLIVYIKSMVGWGHVNELLVGMVIGLIVHFSDFTGKFSQKLTEKYFDNNVKIDMQEILSRNNKFKLKTLIMVPIVILFLFTLLKANVYTRVLGEWVMDLSQVFLYMGQILGIWTVQNTIDLIVLSKTNPLMILMFIVYILFASLI